MRFDDFKTEQKSGSSRALRQRINTEGVVVITQHAPVKD